MTLHLWGGFLGMVLGAGAVALRTRTRTGRARDLALLGLGRDVVSGDVGQATT